MIEWIAYGSTSSGKMSVARLSADTLFEASAILKRDFPDHNFRTIREYIREEDAK